MLVKMKIGVHADHLASEIGYGIRNYLITLLTSLSVLDRDLEFHLYARAPLVEFELPDRFVFHLMPNIYGWWYYILPYYARKHDLDVLLMPRESTPFFLGRRCISFAFDFMHLHFQRHLSLKARLHYFLAENLDLPRARRIVAISESTKEDVVRQCGIPQGRIAIVNPACDPKVFYPHPKAEIQSIRTKYGLSRPYLLNSSSVWWYRKNLLNLLSAFARFRDSQPGYDLVITGRPGPLYPDMQERIETLGIQDDVRLLNKVPQSDVPILMSGCSAFVFPSFHEGFGMPVVEAMNCGVPVITSNTSAMPEAGGDAAILIDPNSLTQIAEAMERVVTDSDLRTSMIERGEAQAAKFTPEVGARRMLDVIYGVYDSVSNR
jgi:glycosyltransferase involved in cell wall biosynthesis